ncbi:tetratricopeptide repeat protein [Micrococcus luteus]|uniref:hypothetical protein n=1 Tax=Micrococcus luteus TaxID=1270 RepID=UPI003626F2F1
MTQGTMYKGYPKSTFQQTLVGLDYRHSEEAPESIFAHACVKAFRDLDWSRYGFTFTQVFEPGVLAEIAYWEGVPLAELAYLVYQPSSSINELASRLESLNEQSPIERINLASVLITLSRFDLAERVVNSIGQTNDARLTFEIAWLRFMISNRRDDGIYSADAFASMRIAATSGEVPIGRLLDASTQAIVWYLKRREVSRQDLNWFVAKGAAIANRSAQAEPGSVSSWYRGIAMLPAAQGLKDETREYMEKARRAADMAVEANPGPVQMNFIKTYYESTLKEHLYVTRDFGQAVEAGTELIQLDPGWSVSYGELAEVYEKFGRKEDAAHLYMKAAELGPPYVGHHLLRAAENWEAVASTAKAIKCYRKVLKMVPQNVEVIAAMKRCMSISQNASSGSEE